MSIVVPRKKMPVLPVILDTSATGNSPRRTFEIRPFLVSLFVHLLLIAFMACIVFEPGGHFSNEAIFAVMDDGGPDDATFDGMEDRSEPVVEVEPPPGKILPNDASPVESTEIAAVLRTLDSVAPSPAADESPSPDPSDSLPEK